MEIHWTEYIVAFLTPVIAVIALFIAYMQFKLASNKLKLELYEKRYVVYKGCMNIITHVMTSGNTTIPQQSEFLRDTSDAKWLLSVDIAEYIDEVIWKTVVDIETLCSELVPNETAFDDLAVRTIKIHERADKKIFISEQRNKINELFSPFLSIRLQI